MHTTFDFICFLVAFVAFVLAAVPSISSRINLIAVGLAAFTLPFLVAALP